MAYSKQIFVLVLLITVSVSQGFFKPNVCSQSLITKAKKLTKLDIMTVPSESYRLMYSSKNMVYSVRESKVKYLALREHNVELSSKDDSVTIKFEVRVSGVLSVALSSMGNCIESLLNCEEVEEYKKHKLTFMEGLNVPFLRFLGVSLDGLVTQTDMERKAVTMKNYLKAARQAQKVIESVKEQTYVISGSIKVTSLVSSGTAANVYLKYAEVTTSNGSKINVISTSTMDLVVACEGGLTESFHGTEAKLFIESE